MAAESQAARSLRRAASTLDGIIASLVEMRPTSLRRSPSRLDEVEAALRRVVQDGIPTADRTSAAAAARALKGRLNSIQALLAGAKRFAGAPAEENFLAYTATGEAASVDAPQTLVCEL